MWILGTILKLYHTFLVNRDQLSVNTLKLVLLENLNSKECHQSRLVLLSFLKATD